MMFSQRTIDSALLLFSAKKIGDNEEKAGKAGNENMNEWQWRRKLGLWG
jgi:hypothetical protein